MTYNAKVDFVRMAACCCLLYVSLTLAIMVQHNAGV